MARNYVQEKLESIPGNEANAPTLSAFTSFPRAQSSKPSLNPKHLERDDEIGNNGDVQAVGVEGFEPDWSKKGRLYPGAMLMDFTHFFGQPAYTAGNGVITDPDATIIPTGAHRWVWTAPFGPTGASPKTMQKQFAYVEENQFFKAKGCAAQDLTIETPQEGGANFEISGPLLHLARISDPGLTATPESVSIQPFKFKGLDLTSDLASAAAASGFTFKANNPMAPDKTLAANSFFNDVMEYDPDGLLVCTAEIERRHLSNADFDALAAATGFALTARWVSESIITGGYPFKLWIAMSNAQYVDDDMDELSNSRRAGDKLSLKATTAGSASVTITLVNATSSIA